MSIDADFLLARLPAFYRQRDAELGGPLRALLTVMAEQGQALEDDIARLYDNWFIETCDDWLVPYIGDLLGVRGLHAVAGSASFGQRALVANTLRLRRRKGTVAVLEQLALDSTGWRVRAVEFFSQLATSEQLNHLRPNAQRTLDLRRGGQLERIGGPFDPAMRSVEVRNLPSGRYNITHIGLFLWRLQAYAVRRAPAVAASGEPGRYHFDPLGRSLTDIGASAAAMLYNRPRSESEITALAGPEHLPEPLSRRALHDELSALRQALTDGGPPLRRYFSQGEGGAVLRIWLDDVEVPAEHLFICNLSPLAAVAPEDWRRPPAQLAVTRSDGSGQRLFPPQPGPLLVGVDPVLGRIALPAGSSVNRVEVAYAYGFAGDIGGGPYDRRPQQASDDAAQGLFVAREFDRVLQVPEQQPSLAAALATAVAGERLLIRISCDWVEQLSPDLFLPDSQLAVETANQCRVVLRGNWRFRGNGNSRLWLGGLLIDGELQLQGALRQLQLRHCTLAPGAGGISHSGNGAGLELRFSHSLCGPLRANNPVAGLTASHCAFDGQGGDALELPLSPLHLDRCTLVGRCSAGELHASNSLFTARLTISHRQQGCVRFCYLAPGSLTPKRFRCQPDLAVQGLPPALAKAELARVSPSFTSTTFGHPAYLQLHLATASEIRRGAEDGAEMGLWNLLQQPQREANLQQAVAEYLRFGLEAGAIFVN